MVGIVKFVNLAMWCNRMVLVLCDFLDFIKIIQYQYFIKVISII